jgi:erythritol kinase
MIAAVSVGRYGSMDECAAEWVAPLLGEAEPPDRKLAETYDRAFEVYRQAHAALRPVWRSLAAARDN